MPVHRIRQDRRRRAVVDHEPGEKPGSQRADEPRGKPGGRAVMAEHFYRSDAVAKVTGRAIYGVDLSAPGMLLGGVVRASVPCGRITTVDIGQAEAMPGVTVLTADDLPVPAYGMVIADQPPLASTRVRFAAEPVAIVAAPDETTLRRAIDAVRVDIAPEPGVFDVEEALRPGTPLVHPDLASYPEVLPTERDGNICGRSVVSTGDVNAAFARACTVVESRFVTPRVHQGYIEPRACLAIAEPDGGFHVTTSTQNPFGVRAT